MQAQPLTVTLALPGEDAFSEIGGVEGFRGLARCLHRDRAHFAEIAVAEERRAVLGANDLPDTAFIAGPKGALADSGTPESRKLSDAA